MATMFVASDLHLETYFPKKAEKIIDAMPQADVVVLAGDIVSAAKLLNPTTPTRINAVNLFSRLKNNNSSVVYVLGNHEHYHGDFQLSKQRLTEFFNENQFDNVTILDNGDMTEVAGRIFIGGTMWTDYNRNNPIDVQAVRTNLNDYYLITNDNDLLLPSVLYDVCQKTVNTIVSNLSKIDCKAIVVTHHAPSYRSVNSKYRTSNINAGFASDFDSIIIDNTDKIELWIHGHMHDPVDYMVENTRVICNPGGYPGERTTNRTYNIINI